MAICDSTSCCRNWCPPRRWRRARRSRSASTRGRWRRGRRAAPASLPPRRRARSAARRAPRDGADVDAGGRHRLGEGGAGAAAEGHALADDGDDRVAVLGVDVSDQARQLALEGHLERERRRLRLGLLDDDADRALGAACVCISGEIRAAQAGEEAVDGSGTAEVPVPSTVTIATLRT